MRRLAPCLVLLAACAGALDESDARRDDIVGGIALSDGGYPAVYMIYTAYNTGTRAACTATLITPRTLLTAAHCVDPRKAGATTAQTYFVNVPVAPPGDAGLWQPVVDVRFHPLYQPADLFNYDIAAVLLPAPSAETPFPFNRADVSGLVGQPLTAIGYGVTAEGANNPGTRRLVDLTFRAVNTTHIALGDQSAKGICDGDSGGPSLHTFPDGVTRVVGVHSYKQPSGQCHDGLDTRVDLHSAFIQQWISDKEGPTCVEDGLCKAAGCAPVDPDCPVVDAGAPDAGTPDAGAPSVDAGAPDAGTPLTDAGAPDAGTPSVDSGTPDAGGPVFPDAGGDADAGSAYVLPALPPVLTPADSGGCAAAPAPPALWLLLTLLRLRRRDDQRR